jgi:hypothetical protein
MIFNEEKAKEIIEKFGLNPNTYKTWKSRNIIPDKYEKENYKFKAKAVIAPADNEKAHEVMTRRLVSVLKLNAIQTLTFSELIGVDLLSVCSGNRRLSQDELSKLKVEITRLKTDISNILNRGIRVGVIEMLGDKRIKPFSLMRDDMSKSTLSTILQKRVMSDLQFELIKKNFLVLLLQLKI